MMALDHSRLGLENKSGRIFCVRQVYFTKSCQQIWGRVKNLLYFLYITFEVKQYYKAPFFFHTDLGQNAVFHNFAIQIALIQYSGRSKHAWAFSETVKNIPKSPNYSQPVLTFDKRQI